MTDQTTNPNVEPRLDCQTYSVVEAGKILGMSRNATYAAVERGDVPSIRLGKLIRVPKVALQRLLEVEG